jgi:hypothetical protein
MSLVGNGRAAEGVLSSGASRSSVDARDNGDRPRGRGVLRWDVGREAVTLGGPCGLLRLTCAVESVGEIDADAPADRSPRGRGVCMLTRNADRIVGVPWAFLVGRWSGVPPGTLCGRPSFRRPRLDSAQSLVRATTPGSGVPRVVARSDGACAQMVHRMLEAEERLAKRTPGLTPMSRQPGPKR